MSNYNVIDTNDNTLFVNRKSKLYKGCPNEKWTRVIAPYTK